MGSAERKGDEDIVRFWFSSFLCLFVPLIFFFWDESSVPPHQSQCCPKNTATRVLELLPCIPPPPPLPRAGTRSPVPSSAAPEPLSVALDAAIFSRARFEYSVARALRARQEIRLVNVPQAMIAAGTTQPTKRLFYNRKMPQRDK